MGSTFDADRERFTVPGPELMARMNELASEHGAVNLVQGFPDVDAPPILGEALRATVENRFHQYSATDGVPALRRAVAELCAHCGCGRYDADAEILITTGCTAALSATARALLKPGDEVIIFEPFWHLYPPIIRAAGGVPIAVPLKRREQRFALDVERLQSAIGPRTRMILVNTPHNPTGMVLDRHELETIAEAAIENDLLVISDQVYEFLNFAEQDVGSIAALPGMRERTVIVSSASKTMSITGWRVGWALAPRSLIMPIHAAHILLSLCPPTPLQVALAQTLAWALGSDYLPGLPRLYREKRDLLFPALRRAGFDPVLPDGGFFIVAYAPCASVEDTMRYCVELTKTMGVALLPACWFFEHPEHAAGALRISFCKQDSSLREAAQRLDAWHAQPSASSANKVFA